MELHTSGSGDSDRVHEIKLTRRTIPEMLRHAADKIELTHPSELAWLSHAVFLDVIHQEMMEEWRKYKPR